MLRCGSESRAFRGSGPASGGRPWRGYAAHDDGVQGAGRGQSADDARGDRLSRRRRASTTTCSSPRWCRPPSPAARATLGQGGALPRLHRPAHRPQPQGQVRRPRALGRAARLVGEQRADGARALRAAARRHARPHPRRRALRAGPLRRRRPRLPAERPRRSPSSPGTASSSATCCAARSRAELAGFVPGFTILNCPSFQADPARHGCRSETVIAISFEQRLVLIGGTAYAGENKKSVFTVLNYLLPEQGRDADALLGQPRRGRPGRRRASSSASPAPARPRSRPTRRAC